MKRLVTSMILGTMIISSASMSFANAKPMEKITFATSTLPAYELTMANEIDPDFDGDYEDDWAIDWTDLEDSADYEMPSFEDFMEESKDFLKTVDKASESKLKGLYEEAVKLDKAEKYEEASKKWDAFDEVFDKFIDQDELAGLNMSFDDFMEESKDYMKSIDKDSNKKLKGLYEEAIKLEKAEKYEDAMKKWDAFYEVFDKFVDESKLPDCETGWADIEDMNELEGYIDVDGDGFDDDYYDGEDLSFDDLMKEMKDFLKDIPSKDMAKLKSLYEAAEKSFDEEKYEEADKSYDEFYTLLDKYFEEDVKITELDEADFEMPTYKEFVEEFSEFLKPISKEDAKSLESLYNKAVAAEKAEKYEDADKDWAAFDKIIDKYIKDEVKAD